MEVNPVILTFTIPFLINTAASRRAATPAWAKYLLRVMRSGGAVTGWLFGKLPFTSAALLLVVAGFWPGLAARAAAFFCSKKASLSFLAFLFSWRNCSLIAALLFLTPNFVKGFVLDFFMRQDNCFSTGILQRYVIYNASLFLAPGAFGGCGRSLTHSIAMFTPF